MSKIDQIIADSKGKWPGILERLGIDVGTGKHKPCPVCGGTKPFRFDDKDGRGTWICTHCGAGGGIALVMKVLGVDFIAACEEVGKIVGTVEASPYQREKYVDPKMLGNLFKLSSPVKKGDVGHLYLKKRGLHHLPWVTDSSQDVLTKRTSLRVGQCWEGETKRKQWALLAIFSLPDGTAATMHTTFLTQEGLKLPVEQPKRFLPTLKPLSGGAIRLYDVGPVLGVCEGIETAMACHECFDMPVWATTGTALLTAFEVPRDVERLVVFGDNDTNYAGQRAAYALANRVVTKDKKIVEVVIPDLPGDDFLDMMIRENDTGEGSVEEAMEELNAQREDVVAEEDEEDLA